MIAIGTKFAPDRQAFETAVQAGFHRAELWTDAAVLARWREVVAIARAFPLDYAVHFPNRLEQPPEVLENAVALVRALDARALILHQPHMDRYGASLHRLDPSLPLAVENGKLSGDEFERWATRNPGLTLDVEHVWMHTLPAATLAAVLDGVRDFLSRHGGKLLHVHLPGHLPGQPEHRPMYCSRDLAFGVFDRLAEARFTGLIVSEVDLPYQNIHDLQMDVLLFQRWQYLRATRRMAGGE